MSEKIDYTLIEIESSTESKFSKSSEKVAKDFVIVKKLSSEATSRQLGLFLYGCRMTLGPDKKPQIREFGHMKVGIRKGRYHCIDTKDKRQLLADVVANNGCSKLW